MTENALIAHNPKYSDDRLIHASRLVDPRGEVVDDGQLSHVLFTELEYVLTGQSEHVELPGVLTEPGVHETDSKVVTIFVHFTHSARRQNSSE